MHDKQLVNQFLKSGSEKAFRSLYQSQTPRLYQVALRIVGNDKQLAEEIIQDMWVIAIKKLSGFEWRSQLSTWLTGIMINLWREIRTRNEKDRVLKNVLQTESQKLTECQVFTALDLEKAINALPTGYREVIVLYDIEGYKHKEIAELLNIEVGTSKSQLYHARRAMRVQLSDETKTKDYEG